MLSENEIKELVKKVYENRKNRIAHPDGVFDSNRRWYPTESEDCGGDLTRRLRSPSRAWPFSYMMGARTRRHCAVLVERALLGRPVPSDVVRAVASVIVGGDK